MLLRVLEVRGRSGGRTGLLLLVRVRVWLLRGRGAIVGPGWRVLLLRRLVVLRGQLDWVVGRGGHALLWGHARPAGKKRCEFPIHLGPVRACLKIGARQAVDKCSDMLYSTGQPELTFQAQLRTNNLEHTTMCHIHVHSHCRYYQVLYETTEQPTCKCLARDQEQNAKSCTSSLACVQVD